MYKAALSVIFFSSGDGKSKNILKSYKIPKILIFNCLFGFPSSHIVDKNFVKNKYHSQNTLIINMSIYTTEIFGLYTAHVIISLFSKNVVLSYINNKFLIFFLYKMYCKYTDHH